MNEPDPKDCEVAILKTTNRPPINYAVVLEEEEVPPNYILSTKRKKHIPCGCRKWEKCKLCK